MESKGPVPHSQKPAISPYPEPDQSNLRPIPPFEGPL
jgi:hypothetical protein